MLLHVYRYLTWRHLLRFKVLVKLGLEDTGYILEQTYASMKVPRSTQTLKPSRNEDSDDGVKVERQKEDWNNQKVRT